ncbi:MAG: hypothetical protein HY690_19540 [Chloroflexi bacterium]|nr:hypothetical protein [Chloroflexota bacterium]
MFVVREAATAQNWVTGFTDVSGMAPRTGYQYNQGTAVAISDADDLTSKS